jgi:hypothetical protein
MNELGTPGQTHTVTATVRDVVGDPANDVTVDIEILSGPNAGASGSAVTDASGQVILTYTAVQGLAGLGTDVIEACFTPPQAEEVCDEATKEWVDTTPPVVSCTESVNPHGKKIPPAGNTTLPGPKGGRNEDGFYELLAFDAVDAEPIIFVEDLGSGAAFGPFPSDTTIKYTEDADATPESKKMGGTKGQAEAVLWHIIGNGDPAVFAVDSSGNVSAGLGCLVPPPPK